MKGDSYLINGDRWTVVDVAPAAALAEMVAALLEEEGFVVVVRGVDVMGDVLSHLGSHTVGTSLVLVPEADAARAMALVEETVTDYQGEELEAVLRQMEAEGASLEELEAMGVDLDAWAADDEDGDEDDN